MTPNWIVYARNTGGYCVALDDKMDWMTARGFTFKKQMPDPWETIYCSHLETAKRIAAFLNEIAKKDPT